MVRCRPEPGVLEERRGVPVGEGRGFWGGRGKRLKPLKELVQKRGGANIGKTINHDHRTAEHIKGKQKGGGKEGKKKRGQSRQSKPK